MTKQQFAEYLTEKRKKSIEEYNKKRQGFPPSLGIDTVSNRIKYAEIAGYILPKDASQIEAMGIHELIVRAAKAEGKQIPKNVLNEYGVI